MGVTGLWRLIEPAGKPVPVETLENKVLAVDISIWLHQMVKGYQDAKGAPLPNAHLMGLFQRLCKLLYFRIKPIFVFDGGIPDLKRQTIAKRQDNKLKYNSESERLKRELALLIGKKTAVGALLGKEISPKKINTNQNDEDIFKLPALPAKETASESNTDSEDEESSSASTVDLHTVDLESEDFKNIPSKEKYELLLELKETRKMNSWGKLHTLPKKSDNFSDFQMQRLLKRRKVQECIEETEKEIGDVGMSLNDLETLLNEEGIDTKIENLPSRRIASDQSTRYLLINNVKQALADAKKKNELKSEKESKFETESILIGNESNEKEEAKYDELEDDLQKAIQMSLECVDEPGPSISASTSKADESWSSFITESNSDYSDEEQDEDIPPDMSSAKAYIMQYSDFTHKVIENIISSKTTNKNKMKDNNVDQIITKLLEEKSVIEENIDLSSEDELKNESCSKTEKFTIDSLNKYQLKEIKENTSINVKSINNHEKCNASNTEESDLSIKYIDSNNADLINLDTSEESSKVNMDLDNTLNLSNSSDEDFEEVSVTDSKPKSVVQLMLNLEEKVEDDIFADVFENETETPAKFDIKVNESKEENINRNKVSPSKDFSIIKSINKTIRSADINRTAQEDTINVDETGEYDANKNDSSELCREENIEVITEKDNNVETSQPSNTKSTIKKSMKPAEPLSKQKLQSMEVDIENEQEKLIHEKGRLDRIGRNISEQMTKDAQELLRVFGIPYVVAPMEAEAQCAFLEEAKLTDGTITDDSDIWLFGGKTVYRNFFNQKKHVLQFVSERIEKSYNLNREQLILLALLVGSDYTTGITGIGPVTAMEILASFPFSKKKQAEISQKTQYQQIISGLQEFKQWVRTGKRTDYIKLKKKLKNITLTEDFPSVRVVQAYLEPNVEKSKEKFTWGDIDITVLRDYTKDKFGWSQNKLDEIITPVLKRLLDRRNQKTVFDYFKRKVEFQCLDEQMSKRVKEAVKKMDPNSQNNVEEKKDKRTMSKRKKMDNEINNISGVVKVVSEEEKPVCSFIIPKTDACQEFIPQREKTKKSMLENKLKAIEIFRKTKIDRRRKFIKKKAVALKDQAELSESSDSN